MKNQKHDPKYQRKQREFQRRRNDILAVAEDLFVTKGFEETMIDDVAELSGLSKATLYKVFESKDELYLGVATVAFRKLYEIMEQELSDQHSDQSTLISLGNAYSKFIQDHPRYAQFIDVSKLNDLSMKFVQVDEDTDFTITEKEYIDRLTEIDKLLIEAITTDLKRFEVSTVDPRIIATVISHLGMTMKDLYLRNQLENNDQTDFNNIMDVMFQIIDKGLRYYDK